MINKVSYLQTFGSISNPFTGTSIQTSFSANSKTTPTQSNTTSNILWGGVAAAVLGVTLAEWQKKREEEEAARRAAMQNSGGEDNDAADKKRMKVLARVNPAYARALAKEQSLRAEIAKVTAQELKGTNISVAQAQARQQAQWNANGQAIYVANQQFKEAFGKEMDAATKEQAIKDATVNGVFNAGLYSVNLNTAQAKQEAEEADRNARSRVARQEDEVTDEEREAAMMSHRDGEKNAVEIAKGYKAREQERLNAVSAARWAGMTSVALGKDGKSIKSGKPLAAPVQNNLANWFDRQINNLRDALFSSGDEPPTFLDRLNRNSEWNQAREYLVRDIERSQNGDKYYYNDNYLGLGLWNSTLSIEQMQGLQRLVDSREVSWNDTLESINTFQSYQGYDNAQMVSALREIYYKDALDNFILGAQGIDSSILGISGNKNGIDKSDALYARALLLLTTQGDNYADPVIVIQHPQGYSETGEFEFDHIVAALDGYFHNSPNGYISLDMKDNEVRPPSIVTSVLKPSALFGGPFFDPIELGKNLVSKGLFLRMNTDTNEIDSVFAVTWLGDLAGSTARAYEYGNAEEGYAKEMPPQDLESDMLGVLLVHNHAISANGTNLAEELSSTLSADSPYVTNKYTQFADIIGLETNKGQITPETAQDFIENNYDMVADLGTGFYIANNYKNRGEFSELVDSALPNGQEQIQQYAKDQIEHFLQQLQNGVQMEAGQ